MPTFQFFKKGQKVGTPDLENQLGDRLAWHINKQATYLPHWEAHPHFFLLRIFKYVILH